MNRVEFSKYVQYHFNWLIELGYKYRRLGKNISFEKSINDETFSIKFFWAEFHVIKIEGILALKGFDNIEKVITDRTGESHYTIHKLFKGEISKDFDSIANGVVLSNGFYIKSEKQVKLFSEVVQFFYNNDVIDFFEKFKSMENVSYWLKENEIQNHSNLLVLTNNSMALRKLIIFKKTKSSEYKNLYEEYKTFLIEKNNENKRPYTDMFTTFLKFEDYFNSSSNI
ncbi:hypothetical protein DCS32_10495 [Dokdonia sp. Dokd-P16]|uniref:hypothetical protein n=1 Tax=Dokdonia sp. Dokd-P16 TaxID=2173169 RepID=UPI000D54A1EE|nr:hypothetical protein [Dokdonia sp. Dokd-P16]AWH74568.1 hypothetical protein DCS32_10495 [Dokdonia sp. Dokd-P16]